jgi:DNA invertase Pin-like site-specific DNA recombinase
VRVSKERDGMIAPELQAAAIDDHCARHGYRLVDTVTGLDESGSRSRSAWWARLEQVAQRVEAGEVDVVVVWKLSRVARNRRRWAVFVDRVEAAGARLESATEPNERTASGRFARGMLAELAAFEAERIGETWREVHARRLRNGRPTSGRPRFGYRYDPERKLHEPDPVTGPILAELYRRYVAGASIRSLAVDLNRRGLRTNAGYGNGPDGGPWGEATVRGMLDSGFGAGFILSHGEHLPGAHEPVIDLDLWHEYRAQRAARRVRPRTERSAYLLSGLVRCGYVLDDGTVCGAAMTGSPGPQGRARYRCRRASDKRQHPGGVATAVHVEAAVLDHVRELAADLQPAVEAAVATARRADDDAARIERDLERVQRQLVDATRKNLAGVIPDGAYLEVRDDLQRQSAALEARLLQARSGAARGGAPTTAGDLLEVWDLLSVEHRRGALRALVDHVVVVPARPRCRVRVVAPWDADARGGV